MEMQNVNVNAKGDGNLRELTERGLIDDDDI